MHKVRITNLLDQAPLRRKLRHKATMEEIALWQIVKGKQICGLQFRRQFSVGPYVLDFYCPQVKLCIEVDGLQHHSDEEMVRDERRDNYLRLQGIEVLRIDNNVIWHSSDIVVNTIMDIVKGRLSEGKYK